MSYQPLPPRNEQANAKAAGEALRKGLSLPADKGESISKGKKYKVVLWDHPPLAARWRVVDAAGLVLAVFHRKGARRYAIEHAARLNKEE